MAGGADLYGGRNGVLPKTFTAISPTTSQYQYYNSSTNGYFIAPVRFEPLQAGEGSSAFQVSNPFRDYIGIVRAIDKSKARRNTYDPATIACDILVTFGQHPREAGLNAHLEVLKTQYTHVNETSDLESFRWDLVDPSRAPISASPGSGVLEVTQQTKRPKESSPSRPAHVLAGPSSQRPSTPLETSAELDVDMDSSSNTPFREISPPNRPNGSGPPNERPAAGPARPPPPPITQSAGEFYGSHGHPTYASPKLTRGGISFSGYGPQRSSLLRNSATSDAKSPGFAVVPSPLLSNPIHRHPQLGVGSESRGPASEASSPRSTPGRGRPPKSFVGATGTPIRSHSKSPKKRGRPLKNTQDTKVGATNPKKHGRPFRTTDSPANAGSPSSDLIPKKRGRPSRVPQDLVYLPSPDPVFRPFLCEWKNCPAELHNLDTLSIHVFKVHVKRLPRDELICSWGKCGKLQNTNSPEKPSNALDGNVHHKTRKALQNHIEEAHLVHFAWHMGDGPKGTSLDPKKPDPRTLSPWLFDQNGRQVTPSIEGLPLEDGHPKDNNAKRFMKKREGVYVVMVPVDTGHRYRNYTGNTHARTEDENGMIVVDD